MLPEIISPAIDFNYDDYSRQPCRLIIARTSISVYFFSRTCVYNQVSRRCSNIDQSVCFFLFLFLFFPSASTHLFFFLFFN